MTGRDLIIYILENGLEDEPVFKDDNFIGFMSAEKAAEKYNTGASTIHALVSLGVIEGFKIGDKVYILANAENPFVKKFE